MYLWPMFIACVVHPPRTTETKVLLAASLLDPEYELAGIVMSKGSPPYINFEGTPDGAGRVLAAK